MGKNKPCRNAFYYFMLDFKSKHPQKYPNLQSVANDAGEFWATMNAEDKRPYELKSKSNKNGQKLTKYTTTGHNIELLEKQNNDALKREQQLNDYIENIIKIGIETGNIADEVFHFIHINYFCFCNSERRYYPAEIAVARFTLQNGILSENVFHNIIHPGALPIGYSYNAKQVSQDTHQLEPPVGTAPDNNLNEVALELMEFMGQNNTKDKKLPILYADNKNRGVVENVLQHLSYKAGCTENQFEVASMEHMFYILRNGVANQPVWKTASLSILELEKDVYDFCLDIACSYHQESDVPKYCSKSFVTRLAFIICNNCCGDLFIDLVPGQHIPNQATAIVDSRSEVGSSLSFYSNATSLDKRRKYFSNDDYDTAGSEASSVADPNDFPVPKNSYLNFAIDEAKQMHLPQLPNKGYSQYEASSSSQDTSSEACGYSAINNSSTSQRPRRPFTLSSALSMPGSSDISPQLSRGRGRGIVAEFRKNLK